MRAYAHGGFMRKLNRIRAAIGLLLAAFTASSAMAFYDQEILIEKALNTPTFSVKYSGAAAAMVELRVNGVSVGTRSVSPSKTAGKVDFTIDLSTLNDGDNAIDVRLLDKDGKLVGTQRATIQATEEDNFAPVRLSAPKTGATVKGPVEIKVGFGKEFRNSYVSFFVNDQFKAMTNIAPYSFLWDTTLEPNGWHELQAWIVDEASTTFKTRKIRVFVNNPSGRTERVVAPNVGSATKPVAKAAKAATTVAKTASNVVKTTSVDAIPNIQPAMSGVTAIVSNAAKLKHPKRPQALTTSAKISTPKLGSLPKALPTKLTNVTTPAVARPVSSSTSKTAIKKGIRLPDLESFMVMFNGEKVEFDVAPRTVEGVPIAPVRHLIEKAGGKVDWDNVAKAMNAEADGRTIYVKIGDKIARINDIQVEMEIRPFLEKGRTIVPLSFVRDSLEVNVDYDPVTGHVLITSVKKKA